MPVRRRLAVVVLSLLSGFGFACGGRAATVEQDAHGLAPDAGDGECRTSSDCVSPGDPNAAFYQCVNRRCVWTEHAPVPDLGTPPDLGAATDLSSFDANDGGAPP